MRKCYQRKNDRKMELSTFITMCKSFLPRTFLWFFWTSFNGFELSIKILCFMINSWLGSAQLSPPPPSPHCYKTFRRIPPPSTDGADSSCWVGENDCFIWARNLRPKVPKFSVISGNFRRFLLWKKEECAWWDRTQFLWITIPVLYP